MRAKIITSLLNKEGVVNDLLEELSMIDDTVEVSNFLLDHEQELEELKETAIKCFGQVSSVSWRNIAQVGAFYGEVKEYYRSIMKITNKQMDLDHLKRTIMSMLYAYIYAIIDYLPSQDGDSSELYEFNEDKVAVRVIDTLEVPDEVKALYANEDFREAVTTLEMLWSESPFVIDQLDFFKVYNMNYTDGDIDSSETDEDALEFDGNSELLRDVDSILDVIEEE